MWKRPIRAAVHIGLGNRRLRSVVESELVRRRQEREGVAARIAGEFVDRRGVRYPLDPALRDRLKPAWRQMVDPVAAARPPTDGTLQDRARKAANLVSEATALIDATVGAPLVGRILEVGCYDGAIAFQLAHRPAVKVVASDIARYYVIQRPGAPAQGDLEGQLANLAEMRERARRIAHVAPGEVDFVEDDITTSGLEPGTFDAIVSFEVLEHVRSPDAAFGGMARLLRPGGIVYHVYNPFFSANGGHSLCTLDFPWGHARLDAEDFERYLEEARPTEREQALRFYRESLNRMTHSDLRMAVSGAGLELIAVIPWFERGLLRQLPEQAVAEVSRSYPTATIEDLMATFVTVIARREPAREHA